MADKAFDKYQAEDDHRTLQRGQEIRSDKKRMAGVRRHHADASKKMAKVGRMLGGRR